MAYGVIKQNYRWCHFQGNVKHSMFFYSMLLDEIYNSFAVAVSQCFDTVGWAS